MSYLKQFRILDSDETSVERALVEANEYSKNNSAEIVSVATIAGVGVRNWKLIVAYKAVIND